MRYLAILSAAVLVACTVTPAVIKNEEPELPVTPVMDIPEPKDQKEPVTGKTGVKPKPVPQPCTDIHTGDLKEDIKAKLDCLSRHT